MLALVVLLAAGGAYKFVIAKPAAEPPPPKVEGIVYMLPKEFLLNMGKRRYMKLSVGLVLHEMPAPAEAEAEGEGKPPEGFGPMPQEAIVRSVIVDTVSGTDANDMLSADGRDGLKKRIVRELKRKTDVEVEDVLFPDFTVQ